MEKLEDFRKAIAKLRAAILDEQEMKFSLKYEGELKSSNSKKTHVPDKNRLRWHFSEQLEQLMGRGDFSKVPLVKSIIGRGPRGSIRVDWSKVGDIQSFHGVTFIPVIDRSFNVACSLSIQMDRPERLGNIFENTGDLDNRIKTLFDSLRMPNTEGEARPNEKDPTRKTCICLFENDSMVSALSIVTRPSLEAIPKGHVKLHIDVEIRAHDLLF